MNEKNILRHLSNSIDQAPIQLLETIKDQPKVKQLVHDDITRQKNGMPSKRILISAASIFVLAAIFNFQHQYRTVDSRVYLDVNPSIIIESNRQDNVIGVLALNPEGQEIVEDYKFKGKALGEVTIDLVDRLVMSDFISKSDDVLLVSVYNDNKEKATLQKNEIKAKILNHLAPNNYQPVILTQAIDQSNTIKEKAETYKISEGKLTLIRNLVQLSPKLKVDDLAKLSIDQLIGLAKYLELDLSQVIEKQEFDKIVVPETIKDLYDEIDDADDKDKDDKVKDDEKDKDKEKEKDK